MTTKKPLCLLTLGMAGSGKSTFVRQLCNLLPRQNAKIFVINLDPAVLTVNFPVNLDIRDSINYKKLMSDYQLGPNGAMVTALNMFCAQIEQVVKLLEAKEDLDYIIIDTPGQIEIFNWSVSGAIITECLASSFPTGILYIVDTVRCESPNTFMSNMTYACGIYCKSRLPIQIVFNKCDINPGGTVLEWMDDYEVFINAIDEQGEGCYLDSLSRSLALVMDEFYTELPRVTLSSVTGIGFDLLVGNFRMMVEEYERDYLPDYLKRREEAIGRQQEEQVQRFMEDREEDLNPVTELLNQLKLK